MRNKSSCPLSIRPWSGETQAQEKAKAKGEKPDIGNWGNWKLKVVPGGREVGIPERTRRGIAKGISQGDPRGTLQGTRKGLHDGLPARLGEGVSEGLKQRFSGGVQRGLEA